MVTDVIAFLGAAAVELASVSFVRMARSSPGASWDEKAHQLWTQGEQQAAIDQLLRAINQHQQAVPKTLGLQLVYYVFLLGDLPGAENFLKRLLAMHQDDAEILENLAVVISRQPSRADEAALLFERVCQLSPDSANAWDGLANSFSKLGRSKAAQKAGERSLALKTTSASPLPNWSLPAMGPAAFLQRPGQPSRIDCISFSIWGHQPRYLRGALRNALLIPELYPGWHARFHVDATVPEEFIALLASLGAQVKPMPAGQSLREKLTWRFLVANDPGVRRFLVRDCDSVVNQREVRAVQQWLASDQWFHVMRDWWSHTDPVLAGLWGGIAGVLPDLQELVASYRPPARETANVDQWFLRDVLWGSIRSHALIHDRCFRSEGSEPWPDPAPSGNFHVGQDEFGASRSRQARWLSPWIRRHACLQLPDETNAANAADGLPPPQEGVLLQVILRWPGPSPDSTPPMPTGVSGRIINLDTAVERWGRMEAQIQGLGWSESHRRQPALTASTAEAQTLGLRNGGELGLWRTTTALLEQWLQEEPTPDAVLHVLEDDAILHPNLPKLIDLLRQTSPRLDVLFSEAFLTPSLYRSFRRLERQRQIDGSAALLINGGQYLAGCSSYLMSRDGARRLLDSMRGKEQSGLLQPVDMHLRKQIRESGLIAAISLPFFSTISADTPSTIQSDRAASVYFSQNVDLGLRRLLYYQTWEPSACPAVLQELCGLLGHGLSPDQIEALVLEINGLGRFEGWLTSY